MCPPECADSGPYRLLHSRIQHVVPEDVREFRRDRHSLRRTLFEHAGGRNLSIIRCRAPSLFLISRISRRHLRSIFSKQVSTSESVTRRRPSAASSVHKSPCADRPARKTFEHSRNSVSQIGASARCANMSTRVGMAGGRLFPSGLGMKRR